MYNLCGSWFLSIGRDKSLQGSKKSRVMFAYMGCRRVGAPSVLLSHGGDCMGLGRPHLFSHLHKYVLCAMLAVVETWAAGMVCSHIVQRFS